MADKVKINCTLNSEKVSFEVYSMTRLLDVLRENGHFTGTKEGCGEGECGTCSVFVDGKLVNSCLVPAIQVEGASIQTIEGLAKKDTLHRVQSAFLKHGGAQCGICTPGMILAAVHLLDHNPHPTQLEIQEGLGGNLCRCTGYMKIFKSVVEASKMGGGK